MNPNEARQQLSQTEQSLEQLSLQKKQFQNQLVETEASQEAINQSEDAYKLIGNLMIKQETTTLKKELDSRKEILKVRIQTIEKQVNKLQTKVKELQEIILKEKKE